MAKSTYEDLCQEARYQIEAMCFALRNASQSKDVDALPWLVQSLAIRIEELNGAMMHAASGEEFDYVNELRMSVCGSSKEDLDVDHVV
jgi:hypothetical protein